MLNDNLLVCCTFFYSFATVFQYWYVVKHNIEVSGELFI